MSEPEITQKKERAYCTGEKIACFFCGETVFKCFSPRKNKYYMTNSESVSDFHSCAPSKLKKRIAELYQENKRLQEKLETLKGPAEASQLE